MTLDPIWVPLRRAPSASALLVDFDGTLAPIVDDPSRAAPVAVAVAAIASLATRLAVVGVVTGRPVEFVRHHVADPAVVVVGQYGLEQEVGGVVALDPRAEPFAAAVAAAADEAGRRWPTLVIERKGSIAVTVHWRTAPEAAPDANELAVLAAAHGLIALPGRMACELRPPVAVDKGTAVDALLASHRLEVAVFAGDDHGDLAAFDALDRWSAERAERTAIRIAVASSEAPPELLESADATMDGPRALARELADLAETVGATSDSGP